MALESLAPDQRAVVQLVLQQGRSYADLAGLLGITEDAVRQRAQAGLGTLGSGTALNAVDQGRVADFLLGQQTDDERAKTEGILSRNGPVREWAQSVASELEPIARHGLPELPGASRAPEPVVAEPEAEPVPDDDTPAEPAPAAPAARSRRQRPRRTSEAEPEATAAPLPVPAAPEPTPAASERPRRERQRPRREEATPKPKPGPAKPSPAKGDATASAPSSRLGGAVLISLLAVFLVALVVYLVNRGDDEKSAAAKPAKTMSTATTPATQPVAQLPLKATDGSKAQGLVQINATQEGQVSFTLVAKGVPPNTARDAYAVWLTSEGKPALRLGFAERVGKDGTLATSGPEAKSDPAAFARGLVSYKQLVVSKETTDTVTKPSGVLLSASLSPLRKASSNASGAGAAGDAGSAGSAATPAPSATP